MLLNKILTWLLQNRGKALLTTAVLSSSGYLTVVPETRNDLLEKLSTAIAPYPEYHVYFDSCLVQPAGFNQLDMLSMRLRVCNATVNPLQDVWVKIDSATVKLSGEDSMKFAVASERNGLGRPVRMDSISYDTISGKACALPPAGDPRMQFFKFCAKMLPAKSDTIRVKFTAKIYESGKPAVRREMELRMPAKSLAISLAEN